MAFGTTSAIFRQALADVLSQTALFNLSATHNFKAALYSDTGTPNNNDTAAHNAYNGTGGAWVTANELTSSTQWPAGGITLTYSVATRWHTTDANLVWMDADDTPGSGNVTLSGVMGDLVYDDSLATPVAKQGLAYHAFGSAQGVTTGTFTIVWNANGVVRWTQAPA